VILGPLAASADWAQKIAAIEIKMSARETRPNIVQPNSGGVNNADVFKPI
jgi:hypothetical protein